MVRNSFTSSSAPTSLNLEIICSLSLLLSVVGCQFFKKQPSTWMNRIIFLVIPKIKEHSSTGVFQLLYYFLSKQISDLRENFLPLHYFYHHLSVES